MRGTLPGVPGLSSARLLRPEQADRGYLSVLEFVDDAAYTAYQASDAFRAAHTWPDHAPIDGSPAHYLPRPWRNPRDAGGRPTRAAVNDGRR